MAAAIQKGGKSESMVSKLKPIVDWYRRQPAFARPSRTLRCRERQQRLRRATHPSSPANMGERVREPSHAGSWYTADGPTLSRELDAHLAAAGKQPRAARALIVPHAGYSYSGPAAAWGYTNVDPNKVSRVFLLGPSHHVFLRRCALSVCDVHRTPIGDLRVDRDAYDELRATGEFVDMDVAIDEAEHSLEMHLPYIRKVFESRPGGPPPLVPVMVGALTPSTEARFGDIFAPFLDDPANLFVVSSDFCHWGRRFGYTPWEGEEDGTPLHTSIEALDRTAMRIIEAKDADGFERYLAEKKNTICGRHPIGVYLRALEKSAGFAERIVAFTRYEQSSRARGYDDSSVSYASAVVF